MSRRALKTGNAHLALAAAAELGQVGLADALSLLLLIREDEPVLYDKALVIAYAVHETGRREMIGIDLGEAETEAFWRDFLRSLRARGLSGVRTGDPDLHHKSGVDFRTRSRVVGFAGRALRPRELGADQRALVYEARVRDRRTATNPGWDADPLGCAGSQDAEEDVLNAVCISGDQIGASDSKGDEPAVE
jgi:hypothetical protein